MKTVYVVFAVLFCALQIACGFARNFDQMRYASIMVMLCVLLAKTERES